MKAQLKQRAFNKSIANHFCFHPHLRIINALYTSLKKSMIKSKQKVYSVILTYFVNHNFFKNYNKSIKIKPDYVHAYNNLGNALLEQKNPKSAISPLFSVYLPRESCVFEIPVLDKYYWCRVLWWFI